jgi:hypothetical protein
MLKARQLIYAGYANSEKFHSKGISLNWNWRANFYCMYQVPHRYFSILITPLWTSTAVINAPQTFSSNKASTFRNTTYPYWTVTLESPTKNRSEALLLPSYICWSCGLRQRVIKFDFILHNLILIAPIITPTSTQKRKFVDISVN